MTRRKNDNRIPGNDEIRAFLAEHGGPAPASAIHAALCAGVQPVLFRAHCNRLAEAGELIRSHDATGRNQYGLPHQIEGLADVYAPRLPAEYTSRIVHGVLS